MSGEQLSGEQLSGEQLSGEQLSGEQLSSCQIGKDDPIPNELKTIWITNFDLIKELESLIFHRAVIPEDAFSLGAETIDVADVSETLICSAIYVRYKRRCGKYLCQLIFTRTKVIRDLTIPCNEPMAALLNASTDHVVSLSLKDI